VTVAVEEEPEGGANVKSWPVPLSATLCGLPPALSLNDSLPEAEPPVVGEKLTATVHVELAVTGFEVEHVVPELATANGPLALIAVNVKLALPMLVTITVCVALVVPDICAANVREETDKLTTGPVPVPVKVTACGLPAALSVRFNVALRFPTADGVKLTLTEQVPLGATAAAVQVSEISEKSPVFVPPTVTAEMARFAVPELVTVSTKAVLAVFRG
jgi:hypothetical protein